MKGSFGVSDIIEAVERNDTLFGTRQADVTINKLDIPSTYQPNNERHKLVVNGTEVRDFNSPNFTNQPGTYNLTGSDGDTVIFGTREQFRYVPNYEAVFGLASWYETAAENLSSGQRLIVELTDKERNNGYQFEFTPGETECRIISAGVTVDTLPESDWGEQDNATDEAGNPFDYVRRDQPLNPRGFLAWYGVGAFRPEVQFTRKNGQQEKAVLGFLSNNDDVATEEINLKPKVVLDADPGVAEYTVKVGSIGTLIQGNAQQFNRPRSAVLYGLGGDIGPTYVNNAPVLAKRHRADYKNVNVLLDIPEFSPSGNVILDIIVGAVAEEDTDATDFAVPRQGDGQNNAIEYTTNVTTFPTETRAVPTGGTAEVPNVRPLATSVAEGAKNDPAKAEAGPDEQNKRVLGEDEVALYIPRTAGSTSASLNWLRPTNTQDW